MTKIYTHIIVFVFFCLLLTSCGVLFDNQDTLSPKNTTLSSRETSTAAIGNANDGPEDENGLKNDGDIAAIDSSVQTEPEQTTSIPAVEIETTVTDPSEMPSETLPSETTESNTTAETPTQAIEEQTDESFVIKSSNILSDAEKQALLDELDIELDKLIDVINNISTDEETGD